MLNRWVITLDSTIAVCNGIVKLLQANEVAHQCDYNFFKGTAINCRCR